MDRLPQELKLKVASFIPRDLHNGIISRDSDYKYRDSPLIRPDIACLSRSWQAAMETVTFREVHTSSVDLISFRKHFSSIRRRRCLRKLHFNVLLPTYSDEACGEYETDDERMVNNEVASEAVSSLLQELSGWPANLNIALDINYHSPMDAPFRDTEKYKKDTMDVVDGRRRDYFNNRFRYSYIHLTYNHQLKVPCVRSFTPLQGIRSLAPSSLVSLTARFPSLSSISWIYMEPGPYLALQKQLREDFVTSLEKFKISSDIKELRLGISTPSFPHSRYQPNLVCSSSDDPLSAGLSRLICESRLKKLVYEGQLDPSFFWSSEPDRPHSAWDSLEEMTVIFDDSNPSGEWYFTDTKNDDFDDASSITSLLSDNPELFPPGYGTQDDTEDALDFAESVELDELGGIQQLGFTRTLNEKAILPLLEAFARRLLSAQSLVLAELSTQVPMELGEWYVWYGAPGHACGYEQYMDEPDTSLSRTRIFFHFLDWEPEESVVDLFRGVGRERYGQDAIITFLPALYE